MRGGKRPGAGRPKNPDAKQTVSVAVHPEVREYLSSQPSASQVVDETIRRTANFRAWKKLRETLPKS